MKRVKNKIVNSIEHAMDDLEFKLKNLNDKEG